MPSAACLTTVFGLAASFFADSSAPRFTRLSVRDGLSQSSVETILQDRNGFLWFGSQEGLNRYDGYRFTVHRARDEPGFLVNHTITALIQDQRGDLWVGTAGGLHRHELATGRFDPVAAGDAPQGIVGLVESASGLVLFTTTDGGLWLVEASGTERAARRLGSGEGIADGARIGPLARDSGSSVWGAGDGRLLRVEIGAGGSRVSVVEVLRDLGSIRVLATDPSGNVWIGRREDVLLRYRPADGGVDRFPNVPRDVLALRPGSGGELWIGARGGGLARLDPESGAVVVHHHDPADAASVSRDDVAAIYEDRGGNLWVGVWNGGVNRLDPYAQAFRSLRRRPQVADSLPADDVVAMTETADGRLWLASRGGLLAVGDPRSGRFRAAASLGRARPYSIGALDSRLYVGTGRGLVALETAGASEVALGEALRAQRLHERPIAGVRTAGDAAWIASERTVCRLEHERTRAVASVRCSEAPVTAVIHALSPAVDRRVWVGTVRGELLLAEADTGSAAVRFRRLDLRASSGSEPMPRIGEIGAILEDRQGRLWVGTRQGLGRTDPATGATQWLGERAGLPSTTIAGIAEGNDGFVWIAQNSGLTRIDPASGAMSHFGDREGAQGTGYAEGAWAAGPSGLLYFAGQGVTAFDPSEVRSSPDRPGIVFTGLEILRRPVAPRWRDPGSPIEAAVDSVSEVVLGPTATVFSVEMAALHFVDPPSNRIAYKLEGFDPDWIETDAQHRVATYTRLAPGRYVLHARARTKNGLWSDREASLAIRILPPWWRTRAALVAWTVLGLAAAALTWGGVRRSVKIRLALVERETLRRESLTDPLTGLYNRRFLTTHLQLEVPKLLREHEARPPSATGSAADLLLVVIDVDHFKAINDRYSHTAGDRTLASIARVLRAHVRDSDLAVRWGGDEFLVVWRSMPRSHAAASVERLRVAVEELGRAMAADGGPACTLSIGYAAFPFLVREPRALSWEQTLHLADHALLVTKRRCRNSHTGLGAMPGLASAAVLAFLAADGTAPLPEGMALEV